MCWRHGDSGDKGAVLVLLLALRQVAKAHGMSEVTRRGAAPVNRAVRF